MKYQGSKRLISKDLLKIILPNRNPGQVWVEPFVGGGNMIDKVENPRIGADVNQWAISALKSIRDNPHELPKDNTEFTKDMFLELKSGKSHPHKGFIGFCYSFGSKWFDSWAGSNDNRDYIKEAFNNAKNQSKYLQGIDFVACSYEKLEIPEKSLIYCDPPYYKKRGYKIPFSHLEFWEWCRSMKKLGHDIYISEENAPDDFTCIFQKELKRSASRVVSQKKPIEKLFTLV